MLTDIDQNCANTSVDESKGSDTTSTFPLSFQIPSGHHAIVTTVFYGTNKKTIIVQNDSSGEILAVQQSCLNSLGERMVFNGSDDKPLSYTIIADCLPTQCSGNAGHQTTTPIDTTAGGSSAGTISVNTHLIAYAYNATIPSEAVTITIVIQAGPGPDVGNSVN